ncbi:MAG TPA: hypothetical protein PK339_12495 [Flavitalea sp.]|nr:hypothetical protein [Flavitalea sp.]
MSLVATKLVEAQLRAKEYWGSFEHRFSTYGAFKAFLDNAMGLLPKDTLEAIKNKSNGRSITIPTLQKQTLAVITERACAIVGVEPNSVKPTFSKITRGFQIKVYPKVSDNNNFSEVDQFANGLNNGIRTMAESLDNYSAAQLEAGKSTDLKAVTLDGLEIVSNAYQVSPEKRERLYFYLPAILEKNDMNSGRINNIATTESMELMLQYESKASSNDQNLAAVLRGDLPSATGFRHYRSNRMTNGESIAETHYLVPFGAIGVFSWNDSDARNRRKGPNGQQSYLLTDPILGVSWDVVEEPICDNLTETYGEGFERTFGTKYQFAADFAFLQAYSSDNSRANLKVEVLQTV